MEAIHATRRSALHPLGAVVAGGAVAIPRQGRTGLAQERDFPVVGEFVGAVNPAESSPDNILVAVLADPMSAGVATRRVRAYFSNGAEVGDWIAGEAPGNAFTFESESGASVEGELLAESVSGSFRLASGAERSFEAARSTGVEGLYQLVVADGVAAFGASEAGIAVSYAILDERLEGTFLLPGCAVEPLSIPQSRAILASPEQPSNSPVDDSLVTNIYRAILRGEQDGLEIVGAMVPTRPPSCRYVKRVVVLADGTTRDEYLVVCS